MCSQRARAAQAVGAMSSLAGLRGRGDAGWAGKKEAGSGWEGPSLHSAAARGAAPQLAHLADAAAAVVPTPRSRERSRPESPKVCPLLEFSLLDSTLRVLP